MGRASVLPILFTEPVMNDLPIARLREIDYDARRDPVTRRHCVHCQRDLSPGSYARFGRVIMVGNGPILTIHPDDVHEWQHGMLRISMEDDYQKNGIDDLGWRPFGVTCARRHGTAWTIPENPGEVKPRLLREGRWRFGPLLIVREPDGRWTTLSGKARTSGDVIGWRTDTLAEAVEQARGEMPFHMPQDTLYRGTDA